MLAEVESETAMVVLAPPPTAQGALDFLEKNRALIKRIAKAKAANRAETIGELARACSLPISDIETFVAEYNRLGLIWYSGDAA